MTSIFVKTQYGVMVELRQSPGPNGARWVDRYACEWVNHNDDRTWESQNYNRVLAVEIGRWTSDDTDVYTVVKLASTNSSGFRNYGELSQ